MNRSVIFVAALLLIGGCTGEQVEEFVFKKTLEFQLKEDCGEDNKECITAVKQQIDHCMTESDWRRYLENDENEEELQRFVDEFFPCFKDQAGNSYFN